MFPEYFVAIVTIRLSLLVHTDQERVWKNPLVLHTLQQLLFSACRYKAIVKYKTAYYSFYLPVALAMYMVCVLSILHLHTTSWFMCTIWRLLCQSL